jgi:hypothetical protein
MVSTRIAILVAAIVVATSLAAQEPKELRDARRQFESLKHPSETDRVRYVTRLVRFRESFMQKDNLRNNFTPEELEIIGIIDAEVVRHPMPATADARILVKRLIGRWESPRRPYFYHPDGTWAADEDTPERNTGKWRIEGNQFFENLGTPWPDSSGKTIILLTATDFVYGAHPFYLIRP